MPKICIIYVQDTPKLCQDMPNICPRYAKDMPKINSRYASQSKTISGIIWQNLKNICRWLTDWLSNIDPRDDSASKKHKIVTCYSAIYLGEKLAAGLSWYQPDAPLFLHQRHHRHLQHHHSYHRQCHRYCRDSIIDHRQHHCRYRHCSYHHHCY